MQPEILFAIAAQIPLVAVVAWAFTTGRVHSDAEVKNWHARANEWKQLYEQERRDRIDAVVRLSAATASVKEVTAGVEDLTREVIRASSRQ